MITEPLARGSAGGSVKLVRFVLGSIAALGMAACAQSLGSVDEGGDEGAGGYGTGGFGTGGYGGSGEGGAATTSAGGAGVGGATTTSAGGAGSGGGATTTTTTTTTTTSSSSSCGVTEHVCGGVCVGNTPSTGCFASKSCQACPSPQHGSSSCDAGGHCQLTCQAGYQASGDQCICNAQCCSDADCGGNGATCQGGTCQDPQPACDVSQCTIDCTLQNFSFCPGICAPDCQCLC